MENVYKIVGQELDLIAKQISYEIDSPISLIKDISSHIVTTKGKRLRPVTVLLGAKCFGDVNQQIIELATVIEFFHISSLLHDDVIDNATTRRNKQAAHIIYGNKAAILVGDYLFSKAFQLLAKINNKRILTVLADTSNIITKGEVQQLMFANNPDIGIDDYMGIIHHKTAVLFEAAAQMGPILANAPEEDIDAMAKFGYYLGRAFQIVDDILDYTSTNENLGKNIGNDLQEGKITIPLIYAIQYGDQNQQEIIKKAIKEGSIEKLDIIKQIIQETHAIEHSLELAKEQIDYCITNLLRIEDSEYRDALEDLAMYVIQRT